MVACSVQQLSGSSSSSSAPTSAASLNANTGTYQPVVEAVSPSIVLIESPGGLGSGVVFDQNGDIVTNDHVLGDQTSFRVTTADGKMYSAALVGGYAPSDIAVIKASGASLHPATWDNSNNLQVGQVVLAMGNPLGLQSSVTQGIVSALGRNVTEPNGSVIPNMIQTSAAINPGNSGGGLVSLDSHVIGMPTLGAVDPQLGSAVPGIGFALSSNTVTDFAQQIIKNGKVVNTHRAYLGVQLGNVSTDNAVVVLGLAANGPAAKAGVQIGDLITSINGKPTTSTSVMANELAQLSPGDQASLKINRNGQEMTIPVTLGELPAP
jgi:S1-C subfamily serine protease